MNRTLSRVSLLAAVALFVTGCATEDEVKHAQSTADTALSTAQQAQQTATNAQATADQARSDVNTLNQKVDSLHRHKGERG